MDFLPVTEFVRDAEATGFCANRINRHRRRLRRIGPGWAVEKCSGVQHRSDALLGGTDHTRHSPVEESIDRALTRRRGPGQREGDFTRGCGEADDVAVGGERRAAVDHHVTRTRGPGRIRGDDDIAAYSDRDRMHSGREPCVRMLGGIAVGAQVIDHRRLEKPLHTDPAEELIDHCPGTRVDGLDDLCAGCPLVRTRESHRDTDGNGSQVEFGKRMTGHKAPETVRIDVNQHSWLCCGHFGQHGSERIDGRGDADMGVAAVVVRCLEHRGPPGL